VPKDEFVFYEGSATVPPCGETYTWIVNLHPHVITTEQVNSILAMLNPQVQAAGGNWRDIQNSDLASSDRKIFKFGKKKDESVFEIPIDQETVV